MLRPGSKVRYGGEVGTVERSLGGNDFLIRTSKGRFAINARQVVPVDESPKAEVPQIVEKSLEELRAELKAKGFKVSKKATREEMEAALKQ